MSDLGTLIDVQNCKAILSVDDLHDGEWTMEPKLDGFRLTAVVKPDGVDFYTRSKKRQDGKLPHIEKELKEAFPVGTVLDGEISAGVYENGSWINNFEYVQSVMLSLAKRSVEVQERNGWLQYLIFDMMKLGPQDIRAKRLIDRKRSLNMSLNPFVDKHTHIGSVTSWEASDELHEHLVDLGFEGSVVKDLESPYSSGERGAGWYKIKAQPTFDAVIVGYKRGKGKFDNMVGAVHFGQPLKGSPLDGKSPAEVSAFCKKHKLAVHNIDGIVYLERGHSSGMDDAERLEMTDTSQPDWGKKELIGTVIEAAHMGIYPNKVKMRHPQFKRFRPDRNASDVGWHDK